MSIGGGSSSTPRRTRTDVTKASITVNLPGVNPFAEEVAALAAIADAPPRLPPTPSVSHRVVNLWVQIIIR